TVNCGSMSASSSRATTTTARPEQVTSASGARQAAPAFSSPAPKTFCADKVTHKETATTTLTSLLQEDVFEPDALRAMSTPLAEASRTLQLDGDHRAREVIAVRIVELAQRGERDAEQLRDRVLLKAGETPSVVPADPIRQNVV